MTLLFITAFCVFAFFRFKVLMLFFQQEEYQGKWFLTYAFEKGRLIDKKCAGGILLLWGLSFVYPPIIWGILPLLAGVAFYQQRVLTGAKRKLAMTQRVKRILWVSMGLAFLSASALLPVSLGIGGVILLELFPLLLVLGNILLTPVESSIQQKFLKEAEENLAKCHPTVIGITGSYGKTSTKHILGHILSQVSPTLWTPGSVNTKMGICRVIREKLTPQHKYFIVEMGAYFKGSIDRLCQFVNPSEGIITAVGQAHYEHFTSQEIIAKTKFELGEWVTKNKGNLVIGTNQIAPKFIPKNMPVIRVGDKEKIYVSGTKQTEKGLEFTFHIDGRKTLVHVPIFGLHHVGNIALAMTLAVKLGIPLATVVAALKTLPQINHRLEVSRQGAITIIDDAYNSNVDGFISALQLLKTLKKNRGILITPGMIELGKVHEESHRRVGEEAGRLADIVIVVIPDRIPSFIEGFKKTAKKGQQLLTVSSFAEARSWMQQHVQPGDAVLWENDLLDLYETKFTL